MTGIEPTPDYLRVALRLTGQDLEVHLNTPIAERVAEMGEVLMTQIIILQARLTCADMAGRGDFDEAVR